MNAAAEVVGRADRVDVAGQVEVEVLHRDDLAPPAAGGAALDPEDRPEARLADAHRRLVPDPVEALRQPDGRRRLALAERRRADRGDEDVLAARPLRLEALDRGERDLGLRRAVRLDLVVAEARARGRRRRSGRGVTERAISRSVFGVRDRRGSVTSHASRRLLPAPRGRRVLLALRRADEVAQEQGVRQRPDAARDGRDRRGDLLGGGEVDVADDPPVDDVDPDVDDDRAGLEHGTGHEARLPGGDDDDVRPPDLGGEVARLRVADGDGRVLLGRA